MNETRQFSADLDELIKEARHHGSRLSLRQVRDRLKEYNLDEEKLRMVFSYLDTMNIDVYDEDLPEEKQEDETQHTSALDLYLKELNDLPDMDEVEELTLFHMAAEGHREAREKIAKRYLSAVWDLAGEIEAREEDPDWVKHAPAGAWRLNLHGDFTPEDLVQEGNIGLLLALDHMERQDSLAAYRAAVLNEVTRYLEDVVDRRKAQDKSDRRVLNRMNQLADASRQLEKELDRKPSLEELSAYLDIPADEIRDLLRVGGEDLKPDWL